MVLPLLGLQDPPEHGTGRGTTTGHHVGQRSASRLGRSHGGRQGRRCDGTVHTGNQSGEGVRNEAAVAHVISAPSGIFMIVEPVGPFKII